MGNAIKRLTGINSINLNGTSSYIDCGYSSAYRNALYTLEFWFTLKSLVGSDYHVMIMNYVNNADCFFRLTSTGNVNFRLSRLRVDDLISDTALIPGNTYHVVASVSLSGMYVYINGSLDKSKGLYYSPRQTNAENFYMGAFNNGAFLEANVYVGAMYADYWDADTVAARYANLSQDIVPENCVMYYNGRDVTNPIIDRSGNENNGITYDVETGARRVRNLRHKSESGLMRDRAGFYKSADALERVNL